MDAKTILKGFKQKLDTILKEYLNQKITEVEEIDPKLTFVVEEIKRFILMGGKRLRPAFFVYGYKAGGGKDEEGVLYTSQALEFFQAFALIHDDIIDCSDLRRGEPTSHRVFTNIHESKKLVANSSRFGLSAAILAGDLALSFANEILANAPFPADIVRKAHYERLPIEMLFGQYLDLLLETSPHVTEAEILKMMKFKTGKYTVEHPLHSGATLAEAPKEIFQAYTDYAIPLGQAFQIQDDILGLFGTEEKIGKPVTSDIAEGKKTLLIIKALEQGNESQKEIIQKALGNPKVTEKDLGVVKKVVVDTGSLAYSQDLAKKLIQRAKKALQKVKLEKEGKDYLLGIADYMLSREY